MADYLRRGTLVAACLLALSGCTAMLLGGGNSDGTQLGRDTRSQAQVATDGAVSAAVRNRFIGDAVLGRYNLRVETVDNVVILQGTVGSYDARDRAVRLARAVDGVQKVDSRIRVVQGT